MVYENTMVGTFLARPNRFLAHVMVNGQEVVCHVKNTGRLKELLIPGAQVIVQFHPDAKATGRKTEYSLIGVAKPTKQTPGNVHTTESVVFPDNDEQSQQQPVTWVNIDSQAPNQAAYEWLVTGKNLPFGGQPENIRREVKFKDSRFDLSFTVNGESWLMEVKGVTLDIDGVAKFPDAPTERGIKHLDELGIAVQNEYHAAVLFVIQMKQIRAFAPHAERHPAFAEALRRAKNNGVQILAYDCVIAADSMDIDAPVEVPEF